MDNNYKELAIEAAVMAGRAILEIYETSFEVTHKPDNSPLTTADLVSNTVIMKYLENTGVPILSEESVIPDYEVRKHWDCCWIVDPLDGTKEFIKRNGEFTVNIAFVVAGKPVFGVIYIPVSQALYVGDVTIEAMRKVVFNDEVFPCDVMKKGDVYAFAKAKEKKTTIKVAMSRSHLNNETVAYLNDLEQQYDTVERIASGSSIKFCLLAEGLVDLYPRFSPCMEWDVAAGQAICESAGIQIVDLKGNSLIYNKKSLYSPFFIAAARGYYN